MTLALSPENKNVLTLTVEFKFDDLRLDDMQNLTFNDVLLPDGTLVKNVTFAQLQALVLTLEPKNNLALTNESKT